MSGRAEPTVDPDRVVGPVHGRPVNRRQKRLWALHDFSVGRGLEIGPLHNRVLYPEQADVHYLDLLDQQGLRTKYAAHPDVYKSQIPEIDYVLFDDERVRSIPETIGDDDPFDWVVASHVIEHVPDVIGWLQQVAEVTVDGGRLVLVVPDRRYCFDIHRPGTTVGQMLLEHELGSTVPSVRAVYDAKRSHTGRFPPVLAWRGQPPRYDSRQWTLEQVLGEVDRARCGEYVDCHVWAFTSGSLVEQLVELRRMGLSPWVVESVQPPPRKKVEFIVVLRRTARGEDASEDAWEDLALIGAMPDWLEQTSRWQRRLRATRRKLTRKQARVDQLTAEVRRLRSELGRGGRSSVRSQLRRSLRR